MRIEKTTVNNETIPSSVLTHTTGNPAKIENSARVLEQNALVNTGLIENLII